MGLNPGDTLQGGKYTVEKPLRTGITSVSYLVRNREGERWLIKVLDPKVLDGLSDYERDRTETFFIQEATKLEKCSSTPHIAKAQMPFKENGLICMPIEYMGCDSLAERQQLILPEDVALTYIRQIGSALAVVHAQNLVHRDIRPSNIFVRMPSGQAVLTNFDLAVDCNKELTVARTSERRDGFSPIELYVPGREARPSTDVYSLAATLYALLTGTVPANADERTSDAQSFVLPQGKNPKITDTTAQAIVSGMQLLPNDRPQSVNEWLAKLEGKEKNTPGVIRQSVNWGKWGVIWAAIGVVATVAMWLWDGRQKAPTTEIIEPVPKKESLEIPEAGGAEQESKRQDTQP